ncbi:hypothetical protein [Dokdonella sp.]|uniref:hypothetical protein n=1 Tax=Dokdonella sp. TaxID=2291710 RepID=UPI002CCF9C60|nr:hypothetical protein [Dokdonella sp.]HPN78523.1 hypothetical protein [Dokdonella sp.]
MYLRFPCVRSTGRTILLAISLLAAHSAAAAGLGTTTTFNVVNNGMSSWTINAQTNPPLTLLRGQTYEFVMQNVNAAHPFNINTINTTGSANRYNDGVTNNGATGTQTLTFVVPNDAPDSLHYNCGNHAAMNGPITIITDVLFADGFDP